MQLKTKYIRLWSFLMFLLGNSSLALCQSASLLDSPVHLDMQNKTTIEVLDAIEAQTICSFFYSPKDFENEKKFSFDNEKLKIQTVLNRLFPLDEVKIKTKGSKIVLVKKNA